ncbi:MAG: SHD1 domain-containing protein [Verrucomicrobiales bacterium]|nr:SHD1 domain-containing protein [Verrucomicrobiota bacterium JB025]
MKADIILALAVWGLAAVCPGAPTEQREWTASNGKTVVGRALEVADGKVRLERADGKVVDVPLSVFVADDVAFLNGHFEMADDAAVRGSGAEPADGLPYPQGEIVGPVEAGPGCSYKLYLPKSLKQGRKAPMLFITNSAGKDVRRLKILQKASEIGGWINVVSMEAGAKLGYDKSAEVSKRAVEHILKTLPVDPDRVYFAGSSTGGAQALMNSGVVKTAGVISWVTYVTAGTPGADDYYIIGGAEDLNRYCTAASANELGRQSALVFHPGGHTAPDWMLEDALMWMNGRFLAKRKRGYEDVARDYEASVIGWLNEIKEAEGHRAYASARFLKDDYGISGPNAGAVDALIRELGADEKNVRYVEGLAEVDDFCRRKLAKLENKGNTKVGHSDPKIEKAALKLAEEYQGVPVIEEVFRAFASPTKGHG